MMNLKKLLCAGLTLAMTASLLAGCSGSSGGSGNGAGTGTGEKGRYVEEDYGAPVTSDDNGYAYIQTMRQLSDGTIRILTNDSSEQGFSLLDSVDGGKTWTASSMDLSALKSIIPANKENTYGYMNTVSLDEDGDMAFIYSVNVSSETSSDSTSTYYLLTKDGKLTEIPVEIPGISKTSHYDYEPVVEETTGETAESETEDDDGIIINDGDEPGDDHYDDYNGIQSFKLLDANTLYALDYNGTIYQIDINAGEVVNTIDDFDWLNDMYICGNKLLLYNWEKVIEYDAATGKKTAEHEALAQAFQNARGSVAVADYLKDGSIIYYACSDGVYSYNLSDDTSEQIVDGHMSSLVSPSGYVEYLIPKQDGDILLKFSDYDDASDSSTDTLLNFSYDAEAAKKPDKALTIYTLQDNYEIRTLAAKFQKSHPDIYVTVDVGVTGDDAVTTSDAIRTLNTEIMAGEGPDLLFLDGLPVDSYVEKGLLADISDITGPMITEGKLFENIANTYQEEAGKLYAIPTKFKMPVIIGKKDMLDRINSLSDLADLAQQYAQEEHKSPLVESWSAISILGDMMPVNSASWFNKDGSLNKENLKAYLQDIKRIYDAFYSTMTDEQKKDFEDTLSYYTSDDMGELDASWFGTGDPAWSALYIMAGQYQLAYGAMSDSDGLQSITSVMRQNKDIIYKQLPGALENVYIPSNVVGINAKSKDMASAKELLTYLLSAEGQTGNNYNGFSVNTESFDKSMTDPNADQPDYDPNQSTSGWGTTDENGNEIMLDMYWPSAEQIADFKSMIASLSTPSYSDNTILSTILNDCFGCIVGDDSIDDAVEQVVKDINIYLSE